MHLIFGRMPVVELVLFLVMIAVTPAFAALDDSQVCAAAARKAASDYDVPYEVMMAVARVESGRGDGSGSAVPWPWTLNVAGKGGYFDQRADAETIIAELLDLGKANFDVGCFQLNYGWHGKEFASAQAMLEPGPNADYAARLLRSKFEQTNDWVKAAGAYHSGTSVHAEAYMAKIERALGNPAEDPGQTFEVAEQTTIGAPLRNWFLGTDSAPQVAMGSLVALTCNTCAGAP